MQKPLSVDKITAPAIISPMSLSEEVQQGFDNAAARRPAGNGQPDGNNGVKAKASMPNIETANAPSLSTVPVPRAPVALRPAPSLPVLRVEESTPTSERMKFGSNHNSNNSMALPAPPAGQYKDMEPVQLTPEDQQRIEAAYNLFPRGYMFEASPEGIWPALEISVNHKQCLSSHRAWIISKNLHYSLRCMVCHVADKNPRAVCKTCSLRVCTSCQKLVTKKKLEDVDVASLREANPIDTEGTEA
ncbi:hypothetical protein BX600DRAFT_455619 [Xylariales sp. PMI_506]|nr:hypothetical protein BX600DRAFT_455619 [Xylariales sp. PMI_506]